MKKQSKIVVEVAEEAPPPKAPSEAQLAQCERIKTVQTLQGLRAALSGTEFVDVQSPEVQAAIARVTGG